VGRAAQAGGGLASSSLSAQILLGSAVFRRNVRIELSEPPMRLEALRSTARRCAPVRPVAAGRRAGTLPRFETSAQRDHCIAAVSLSAQMSLRDRCGATHAFRRRPAFSRRPPAHRAELDGRRRIDSALRQGICSGAAEARRVPPSALASPFRLSPRAAGTDGFYVATLVRR